MFQTVVWAPLYLKHPGSLLKGSHSWVQPVGWQEQVILMSISFHTTVRWSNVKVRGYRLHRSILPSCSPQCTVKVEWTSAQWIRTGSSSPLRTPHLSKVSPLGTLSCCLTNISQDLVCIRITWRACKARRSQGLLGTEMQVSPFCLLHCVGLGKGTVFILAKDFTSALHFTVLIYMKQSLKGHFLKSYLVF